MEHHPGVETAPVYRPGAAVDSAQSRYPGFRPGRTTIAAGTVVKEGAAPVPRDLVLDRDVVVAMRDGTSIYVDVYRPPGAAEPLPAIVSWSPYGKRGGFITLDDFPFRAGVPQSRLSGLDKFEGVDPAQWCPAGYAVVQPDPRGAYRSGGRLAVWDRQEGEDGHDLVEWTAAQPWSSGKIGMAGTSWLGIAQWFVAAERPPHLAAIAPWEGLDDAYRFCFDDGGIPEAGFVEWLLRAAPSENGIEDIPAMIDRHPEFDGYWARKRAAVERIEVPTYQAMSWGSRLHCRGAFEGWHRLAVADRWLRISNALEWPDFYDTTHQADLRRFFDHFLRGVENGWRATPRVRMTVVDFDHQDLVDRAEDEFPLARTRTRVLHLGRAGMMAAELPADVQPYDAVTGEVAFDVTFTDETEVNGYPVARLWLEVEGADDADVFVKLEKLSADGRVQGRVLVPHGTPEHDAAAERGTGEGAAVPAGRQGGNPFRYDGPWGRLRASRRGLSTDPRSAPSYPPERRLAPAEVVELVITLTPVALIVHPGERLRLVVSGHDLVPSGFAGARPVRRRPAGRHLLPTGGDRRSRLELPIA